MFLRQAFSAEDLGRYPGSGIADIHQRIGPEIQRRRIKKALDRLCTGRQAHWQGERRWRTYWPGGG